MQVLPFPHAEIGKKVRFAELPALILGRQLFPFFMDCIPDIEKRQKIRRRICKLAMSRMGGITLFEGALTRVLNAQARGDDEQLASGVLRLGLDQHAPERGINREPGQIASHRSQIVPLIQGTQLLEQPVSTLDRCRCGWIQERKRFNLTQPPGFHAKNHLRKVRPLYFRLGKGRTPQKILFREKPDANTVPDTSAAAFALIRAALGNRFDRETPGAGARVIPADSRKP